MRGQGGGTGKNGVQGVVRHAIKGGSGPRRVGPGWHGKVCPIRTRFESGPSTRWGTTPTGGPHLAAREEGRGEGDGGLAGKEELGRRRVWAVREKEKRGERKIWAVGGLQEKKKKEGEGVGWAEKR